MRGPLRSRSRRRVPPNRSMPGIRLSSSASRCGGVAERRRLVEPGGAGRGAARAGAGRRAARSLTGGIGGSGDVRPPSASAGGRRRALGRLPPSTWPRPASRSSGVGRRRGGPRSGAVGARRAVVACAGVASPDGAGAAVDAAVARRRVRARRTTPPRAARARRRGPRRRSRRRRAAAGPPPPDGPRAASGGSGRRARSRRPAALLSSCGMSIPVRPFTVADASAASGSRSSRRRSRRRSRARSGCRSWPIGSAAARTISGSIESTVEMIAASLNWRYASARRARALASASPLVNVMPASALPSRRRLLGDRPRR